MFFPSCETRPELVSHAFWVLCADNKDAAHASVLLQTTRMFFLLFTIVDFAEGGGKKIPIAFLMSDRESRLGHWFRTTHFSLSVILFIFLSQVVEHKEQGWTELWTSELLPNRIKSWWNIQEGYDLFSGIKRWLFNAVRVVWLRCLAFFSLGVLE